jgi:hypothetical protein
VPQRAHLFRRRAARRGDRAADGGTARGRLSIPRLFGDAARSRPLVRGAARR